MYFCTTPLSVGKFLRFGCGIVSSLIVLFCLLGIFTAPFGLGTGAGAGAVVIAALMLLVGLAVAFFQLAYWCFTGKNAMDVD